MSIFLNDTRKEYIKIFFRKKILTKLERTEFGKLMILLLNLIEYLSVRFCFDQSNYDIYWNQLLQNNHRDLIAIFNLLLPYIDDKEGTYYLHNQIEQLSDISLKLNPNASHQNLSDPSKNNYLITNIQYGLNQTLHEGKHSFGIRDIATNYCLLLQTIDKISNKLFVNWINVRPLKINDYKESNLYKNSIILDIGNYDFYVDYNITVPKIKNNDAQKLKLYDFNSYFGYPSDMNTEHGLNYDDLNNWSDTLYNILDVNAINTKNKGISLGDIFNTIYYDLFYDVYKIKWLIFQGTFENPDNDQIYIEIFNKLIAIPEMYQDIKWNEMNKEKQNKFINNWQSFLNLVSAQNDIPSDVDIMSAEAYVHTNHYVKMLEKIIVSMETNYDLIDSIVSHFGYNKISKIDSESSMFIYDDDDDDDSYLKSRWTNFELVKNIKLIPPEDIYNYLLNTIQQFIYTWYGRNIIIQFNPSDPNDKNNLKPGVMINGLNNFKFNYEPYSSNYESIDPNNTLTSILSDENAKVNYKYSNYLNAIPQELKLGPLTFHFPEKLTLKYKFFYNYAKAFIKVYVKKNDSNGMETTETYYRQNWFELDNVERQILIYFLNSSYNEAIGTTKNTFINKEVQSTPKTMYEQMSVMSYLKYYKRTYAKSNNKYYKIKDPTTGQFVQTTLELFGEEGGPNNIKGLYKYIGAMFFRYIRDKLVDITFESHIYKGLLTEFVPAPDLTDNVILGKSYEEKTFNQFANLKKSVLTPQKIIDYENNSYYFLTGKTYGSLNEIYRGEKKTYFNLLTSEYRWFSFYSMDWISQINFYHRYINNRVIYVTGATGQGKSTQVPKLFLYGLKMIDRKQDGKVICSQPRVTPTRDNSEQISWELGVPITEISSNNKQKIKTYNGYVQYDTQDDSHTVANHNGLRLKLVTDRKLFEELRKYPIYKQTQISHNENKTCEDIEFNIYKADNRDDIIIVDESHEHNLNMDLILTVARDTVRINNSLKLVIVSATMADDEYIYRRYYKEIDDNFSYPYNFLNAERDLSRLFVDRRIHISPPGETTQHKVIDNYLLIEPENYYDAEKLAYDKAMEIATDPNSKGDILFFSLGTKEIISLVKKINEELPSNSEFICLPFYSELPSKWSGMFNSLSKKVKEITVNRLDLYNEIFPDPQITVRRVSPNTYKRVIIIATNIAEASITVNSLKYVIDTGYFISVSDDYIYGEPIIKPKKISESSRIQRRGRVGRVSGGTVYYMYTKNSRLEFKSEPKICIENIFNDLYTLSASQKSNPTNKYSPHENYIVSNINWSEYIYNSIHDTNIKSNIILSAPELKESKIINNLLFKQYTYRNIFLLSTFNLISKKLHKTSLERIQTFILNPKTTYYTFFSANQIYNCLSDRGVRQITGYDIKEFIYDPDGSFYIVHPNELEIKRNLLTGKITEIYVPNNPVPIVSDYIISYKIYKYLSKCFSYCLFIDKNIKPIKSDIFLDNNVYEFKHLNINYEKTTIGRIVSNMIANIKWHEKDNNINWFVTYVIIYAYICNVDNIVLIMIALITWSNYNLANLNSNIAFLRDKYGNEDLEIYYNIALKLNDYLTTLTSSSNDKNKMEFEKEKEQYLNEKNKIKENLSKKQNYWTFDIPINVYERFNLLDNKNKLKSDINLFDYQKEKNKSTQYGEQEINNLLGKFIGLGIIADKNGIVRFIKYYKDALNQMNKTKNTENIETSFNDLQWFKNNVPINISTDTWTNVKKSFIYGFGIFNIAVYNPKENLMYDINTNKILEQSNNSVTTKNNFMVYLIKERNSMSIVINTDLDTLVECSLVNFNPFKIYNFNVLNIEQTNNPNNSELELLEKYKETLNKKQKFISNIIANNINNMVDKKKYKLLAEPNNLVPYIIKLWTHELKPQVFGKLRIKPPNSTNLTYKQYGGSLFNSTNKTKFKMNISKLQKILKKHNITNDQFIQKINNIINKGYYVEINEKYITIDLTNKN